MTKPTGTTPEGWIVERLRELIDAERRDQAVRELRDVADGIDRAAQGEPLGTLQACVILSETIRSRAEMIATGERGPA